jgi:hypothetical protein
MVNRTRTTIVMPPADHDHLLSHARMLFPGQKIGITYGEAETIHIDVGPRRFTFEIGSDDDEYVFSDGREAFVIPLMENPGSDWE